MIRYWGLEDLVRGDVMTKRSGKRSGRPSRPSTRQTRPAKPPPPRWWNRITKATLSIGALAAAITAVLALILPLFPKHSAQNIARFISVQPLSQVPLSEYPQRSAVFTLQSVDHPQTHGPILAVAVAGQSSPLSIHDHPTTIPTQTLSPTTPTQTLSPITPTPTPSVTSLTPTPPPTAPTTTGAASPTGTASPNCTASPTETASPTGTASPNCTASPSAAASPSATSSQVGRIDSLLPLGMSPQAAAAYANLVASLVQKMDNPFNITLPCMGSGCPVAVPVFMLVSCTNLHGQVVKPLGCAKTIAEIFRDGASVSVGSGGQGGGGSIKRQPLGELLSVDLELAGLQGQSVFLSWSIFQENGPNNLSGEWIGNFVADRLQPTTNDDTGSLEMWIPLPEQHGPYFVTLTLTSGGTSLASISSGPFD
jgi:hypothetical protein